MNQQLKSIAKYVVGLGLGGLFLYLAFADANWEEILEAVRNINPIWILLSMSAGIFSHFIRGVRWQMQLKASGYQPSYPNLFAAVMIGYLVNQALPRAGEVARCTALVRSDKVPLSTGFGTVVIERVFDLLILVFLIGLAFILESETIWSYLDQFLSSRGETESSVDGLIWVGAGVLFFSAALWFLRKKLAKIPLVQKLKSFVKELIHSALDIRHMDKPWLFVGYTLVIWGCYWMM
ncbi:MAG: lysylphosphatidylglycerol synthase transmembrane domain-containing protein, partial [Bacteroidota bacterium]